MLGYIYSTERTPISLRVARYSNMNRLVEAVLSTFEKKTGGS